MKTIVRLCLFVWGTLSCLAQDQTVLQTLVLDSTLTANANAVVRYENIDIEVASINAMTIKKKRVVSVFNKKGNRHVDTYEHYNGSEKAIKKLQVLVYDKFGSLIKKYKKKEFKDQSVFDGISLQNDSRVKYVDYTPAAYPYTIVFESEIEKSSTAFIPSWTPISGYYLSVENSKYSIRSISDTRIRFQEHNLEAYSVSSATTPYQVSYQAKQMPAVVSEYMDDAFVKFKPQVNVTLDTFSLYGIEGKISDWNSFGKWQYDHLIKGRDELSPNTIAEVTGLVANATTTKEKAKQIYEYVQNKTRYISVQLGIGGWMPFKASDVDRLGYGDCKALTNYTKALLASQDIPAYYTVVYADTKRDIDSVFPSFQGNHAILNIPDGDEDLWLECTSQTAPFNYIAGFTDNRNVLVLTPEGGVIKKTKKYTTEENTLETQATVQLLADKSMTATLKRVAKGAQYDGYYGITKKSVEDQKTAYKKEWNYMPALAVEKITLTNDKDTIVCTEEVQVRCDRYSAKAGDKLLFSPNVFNRTRRRLPKDTDRKRPIVVERGYIDRDTYEISVPEGYECKGVPEPKIITTDFGTYNVTLTRIDPSTIRYTRVLQINDGVYPKEDYEAYRKFVSDIRKIDTSKIVITTK